MPTPRKKPPPRRLSRKPVKPTPPPPAPRNTRAVTNGASANGRNLPGYEETRQEVQAAVDQADWLQATDTIVLDLFCSELNAYRFTARALARMTDVAAMKKMRAAGLQVRRGKLLLELASSMGFTAEARFKLGLTAAKTARAKQGAVPVRTEERGREVADLLARAGALPPPTVIDAEVVTEQPPEPEMPAPPLEVIVFPHGGSA